MDDYHLINQIGEGSFGRVYKARRRYTGRLVAIKMINKHGQSKDDLDSLRREIDLLQKVNHSNIMRMLSIFETDTDFCIVSELARGDLFQVIDDNQCLPEDVLRNVAAQLVSALAHLHSMKIIHRDMKPQNILIADNDALKVCDFGFARALSQNTLVLTSVKGTPLYMAPELVQEQPYDEKVDVWALGVILYELYNKQPPFFTNSIYKLIQMIANSPIVWPDSMSPVFKSFLQQMLQKDPRKRVSCDELLKHPFIADVQLAQFDDRVYRFKSDQFEGAISQSLGGGQQQVFKPKKSKIPDYQMIFVNPAGHSDQELLLAVKYLRERDLPPDSPLAASFAFHFQAFFQHAIVTEEALLAAAELLRKDLDRFVTPFAVSVQLFGEPNMPMAAVPFFTELLTVPFAHNIIHDNDFTLGDLRVDKARSEQLRDRLLSFLFAGSETVIAETYALLSFFARESDVMLDSFAGPFAAQFVPILTAAICQKSSAVVQSCAFCILARIIERNNDAVTFVQPFGKFLDAFKQATSDEIKTVEQLCLFGAALSFIAVTLNVLVELPEFTKTFSVRQSLSTLPDFLDITFNGKSTLEARLDSFLDVASIPPKTEPQILSYSAVLSSLFCHMPMRPECIDKCVDKIIQLVPVHQPEIGRAHV
jgi:fused-like protein